MRIKTLEFEPFNFDEDPFCQDIWRYFKEEFVRLLQFLVESADEQRDQLPLDLYNEIIDAIMGAQAYPSQTTREYLDRIKKVFVQAFQESLGPHMNDLLRDPHVFMYSGPNNAPFFKKLTARMVEEAEKLMPEKKDATGT